MISIKKNLRNEILNENNTVESIPRALVYSFRNNLYTLLDLNSEPIMIAERKETIRSLCSHQGRLYDASGNRIYDTLTGKVIAERDNNVRHLYSHDQELLDITNYKIYSTFKGLIVGKRDNWILSLCSHQGRLYDASGKGIYDTLTGKVIAKREETIGILCSHQGRLYDASGNRIYDTLTGKVIAKRNELIMELYEHNGKMYDIGDYKIFYKNNHYNSIFYVYETLSGKIIAESEDGSINNLCSFKGKLLAISEKTGKIIDIFNNKVIINMMRKENSYFLKTIPLNVIIQHPNVKRNVKDDITWKLYKNDALSFIEYFSDLRTEEKERIIKKMLKEENLEENKEVSAWLDKNESELVRHVGLSLV